MINFQGEDGIKIENLIKAIAEKYKITERQAKSLIANYITNEGTIHRYI